MIAGYQARCTARVDAALEKLFVAPREELTRIYAAMRYSVVNGGKRVRPLLAYAACEALGGDAERADGAACAVELIHAYSLVHDDLPAMDDDDLRRGQPTTHIAYDEACAILAGDGLQALAFEVIGNAQLNPQDAQTRLDMLTILARAAGSAGMVGGQAIDLESVGRKIDQAALETMHRHKTGALIEASVQLGALASGRANTDALQACAATPRRWAWHSRCRTTSSTWKATPPPSARPRARTRLTTSRPTPRCSASTKRRPTPSPCATRRWRRWKALAIAPNRCAPSPAISSNAVTDSPARALRVQIP